MAVAANLISGWIKKYKWILMVGSLAILVVAIDLYTDIKILTLMLKNIDLDKDYLLRFCL